MSCFTPPTPAQFQLQFFRDFPYAPPELFPKTNPTSEELRKWIFQLDVHNATNIFMYLAAHYLVEAIRASSMGLNSQAKFALESSSVGGVSKSSAVWAWAKDNPQLAKFLTTKHGQIYLSLAYPYTIGGGIRTIPSRTTYA